MVRKTFSNKKGTFNPLDGRTVKHTRIGVWDLYEEREPKLEKLPVFTNFEKYMELFESVPYVGRLIKDVLWIPTCAVLLTIYVVAEIAQAIIPALGIWYQGQLLQIMQIAIDTRTVDRHQLFRICAGRIMCTLSESVLQILVWRLRQPLTARIRRWHGMHLFRARARLDVPTYETTRVQRQLNDVSEEYFGRTTAWDTIERIALIARASVQLSAQVLVLVQVLRGQRDGMLLGGLTLSSHVVQMVASIRAWELGRVWAATTTDEDYIKMEGWKRVMSDASHRKEVVAGNLAEYATSEYRKAADRVGDNAGEFKEWQNWMRLWKAYGFTSLLEAPLGHLSQIVFTLRAVQYPATMPVSLASLNLVQESTSTFMSSLYELFYSTESVTDQLANMRKMYAIREIPNKVVDGTVPFPEDAADIKFGIALEFRNVSFKYPGTEKYALRNISFSLSPGQLCVIVGANGSGKSTILKLIVRLYDPEEGEILLGGHDIRTLKLYDLRQAISVLFQDYTYFPLSIRDNIAIGDTSAIGNDEHVRLAARLGGAEEFIDKLLDGFNTYLDRPVKDHYAGLPEGTLTLFGRSVDYNAVQGAGGMKTSSAASLSGGQMQRLAVARSFMRSVVPEDSKVGLLLFDEPSASLDPVAEHDLFDRLRELRGHKTMLFSSHRFGNLTRYADLILYMNDSVIVEGGTHEELLKRDGDYAKIWNLQAQAFL